NPGGSCRCDRSFLSVFAGKLTSTVFSDKLPATGCILMDDHRLVKFQKFIDFLIVVYLFFASSAFSDNFWFLAFKVSPKTVPKHRIFHWFKNDAHVDSSNIQY